MTSARTWSLSTVRSNCKKSYSKSTSTRTFAMTSSPTGSKTSTQRSSSTCPTWRSTWPKTNTWLGWITRKSSPPDTWVSNVTTNCSSGSVTTTWTRPWARCSTSGLTMMWCPTSHLCLSTARRCRMTSCSTSTTTSNILSMRTKRSGTSLLMKMWECCTTNCKQQCLPTVRNPVSTTQPAKTPCSCKVGSGSTNTCWMTSSRCSLRMTRTFPLHPFRLRRIRASWPTRARWSSTTTACGCRAVKWNSTWTRIQPTASGTMTRTIGISRMGLIRTGKHMSSPKCRKMASLSDLATRVSSCRF